jgi:hypothetical protein
MGYSISSSSNVVSVVVSPRRDFVFVVLIPLWLGGWIASASRGTHPVNTMIIVSGVSVILTWTWLWTLAGKERIEFTASGLTQKRVILGITLKRHEFSADKIEEPHFGRGRGRGRSRVPSGIWFTYEGKKIRVGDDLRCQEAKNIIETVVRQLPQLERCWGSYSDGVSGFYPE